LENEDILDEDVVGAWLDGYAVIAALVDHVCELDIICIHGVEAICILNPLLSSSQHFPILGYLNKTKANRLENLLWVIL
jgi:hypothetical protein